MHFSYKKPNAIMKLKFKKELKISDTMASILINKGIGLEEARALYNDPSELFVAEAEKICGLSDVADALMNQQDRVIAIFADYDVDGFTSGFILHTFLRHYMQYDAAVYYPEREEGYGLNMAWAKKAVRAAEKAGKPLTVVCVDNGITQVEEIAFLKENGAQVYVVDHHEPTGVLPDADAICDAWIDRGYGTHLCAAGVAWKLVGYIAEKLMPADDVAELTSYWLPYVALATVADVMPACAENHAIIQSGLKAMNDGESPAVKALMDAESIELLRTKDIAWSIAPEINACSRMNRTELARELFALEGEADEKKLRKLVQHIRSVNKERKNICERAIRDMLANNDFSTSIVAMADGSDYPLGIIGILAGKLAEALGRPAIVYRKAEGDDIGYGSARAPEGVDVKALVNYEAAKGNAVGALGHAEACGVTIIPSKIDEFNADLIASGMVSVESVQAEETETKIPVDVVITPDEITYEIRQEVNSFGYASKEIPSLALVDVEVKALPWETSSGKRHVLFRMEDSKGKAKYAVLWNGLDEYESIGSPERVSFTGTLDNGAFCSYFKGASLSEHSTMITIDKLLPVA